MGKRSFALLLALVLTATLFSACTKGTTGQTETTAKAQTTFATDNDNFKLSYTQSDSLDPFAAKTQNNQVLADLVFESLFDLDGSYTAQPNLATGYEFTNSTTLKVTSRRSPSQMWYTALSRPRTPPPTAALCKGFAPPRQRTTTPWCSPCATPPLTDKIY